MANKRSVSAIQCKCEVGPYKGYLGLAEYDVEASLFHGRVLGINDVVTFEGNSPAETSQEFEASVDDYLAFCVKRNVAPNKPFSGKFVVRVPSELHRQLSSIAEAREISLNTLAVEGLEARLRELGHSNTRRRVGKTVKRARAGR